MPRLYRAALWLGATAAMAFTIGNHMLGLAAWIAPPLLLLFTRAGAKWPSLAAGLLSMTAAQIIGWRGVLPLHGIQFYAVMILIGVAFYLPYAIDRLLGQRCEGVARLLVFPCAWTITEYLFTQAGQGSWGAIAYAHLDSPALLQLVAVTGLSGVTFLNGFLASAFAGAWEQGFSRQSATLALAALFAALLVTLAGAIRLNAPPQSTTVRAAGIVVDNIDVFRDSWGPLAYGTGLDIKKAEAVRPRTRMLQQLLLDRSKDEARAGAQLIVWSEANALVLADDEADFVDRARDVAATEKIYLFAAMAVMTPGEALAENKLVIIDPAGTVRGSYLKSHPTPGEASVPGTGQIGWIDTPYGRIAWAICYDFDYPQLIAQASAAHADILIDPSWDDVGMTPLHARMATLRAIETGASLFRPTNGGLSIAVDGRGVPLAQVHTPKAGIMSAELPTQKMVAPYSALGDWIVVLATLLLVATAMAAAIRSRPARRPGGTGEGPRQHM